MNSLSLHSCNELKIYSTKYNPSKTRYPARLLSHSKNLRELFLHVVPPAQGVIASGGFIHRVMHVVMVWIPLLKTIRKLWIQIPDFDLGGGLSPGGFAPWDEAWIRKMASCIGADLVTAELVNGVEYRLLEAKHGKALSRVALRM